MPNKMLIDASHPEETRVVVVRGNRIEEFDFESQDKKQLKGNIYLARVTRVEPSLQAAFVEYGGNRHGFLAFSEIHPDYYQIPVADRQALLKADAEAAEAEDDEDENGDSRGRRRRRGGGRNRGRASGGSGDEQRATSETAEASDANGEAETETQADPETEKETEAETDRGDKPAMAAAIEADTISEALPSGGDSDEGDVIEVDSKSGDEVEVESVGAEDALEEVRARRKPVRRSYKIQEVIKRRQILLVQVVKEERGNKGAALTTYLSLAGRYSVLMPNTARGGGISRKITSAQDRKRLKDIVQDLDVPDGMGVILRTAGESRTKAEIKRDYEYLMRMWETVRNTTLQSTAPALVYEEGSLIKRSVRDLYNKDIDEILVSGEDGYREAKDFMRMLMPSHAKVVQPYRDNVPIFARNGIEAQLDRMLQPQVTLKSGGYIIINQTEALVSIDVNSGRSTREHSIEDTALQTNLEAAEEVARQLRLRDLAGLIVIDFIDMEENRNNRAVEKKMKDCLKNDRARIQVGRISHFGLLEMSRQRIRASVLESTMKPCPHCGGTGHVRSDSSIALHVIRAVEEFLLKDNRSHLIVRASTATALYVLNHKRSTLVEFERRFGVTITLEADETIGAQLCTITRGAAVERPLPLPEVAAHMPEPEEEDEPFVVESENEEESAPAATGSSHSRSDEQGDGRDRKKRRRRRRRGGRDREQAAGGERSHTAVSGGDEDGDEDDAEAGETTLADESGDSARGGEEGARKRRRGKRGGRRNRREEDQDGDTPAEVATATDDEPVAPEGVHPDRLMQEAATAEPAAEEADAADADKPKKPKRASRKAKVSAEDRAEIVVEVPEQVAEAVEAKPAPRPARRRAAAETADATEAVASEAVTPEPAPSKPVAPPTPVVSSTATSEAETKPKKGGWWQRKGFF